MTMTHTTDLNQDLLARAKRVIPGGVNSPVRAFNAVGGVPRFVERAQGAYFWDKNGQRFTDYIGSWGPIVWATATRKWSPPCTPLSMKASATVPRPSVKWPWPKKSSP